MENTKKRIILSKINAPVPSIMLQNTDDVSSELSSCSV